jgi:hypothetical protein
MEQLAFEFARKEPLPPPLALDAQTEERVVDLMAELIATVYEMQEGGDYEFGSVEQQDWRASSGTAGGGVLASVVGEAGSGER